MPKVIIDPNDTLISNNTTGDVNLVPELQDLTPYVELVVYRNRLADYKIDINGNVVTSDVTEPQVIPMMGFNPDTGVYENNFEDDTYVYQNFGIKSIDINIKSKFIPTVNISFIDVKGQSTFNSNEKTKDASYRALFDFPPATFILKVKGVFGKTTRFDLHLLKVNSKFESTTGNFIINCEFVGKSFVPLTDMKLGWLKAVSRMGNYTVNTTNTSTNSPVNNFQDLYYKSKQLYSDIKELIEGNTLVTESKKNANYSSLISEYRVSLNKVFTIPNNTGIVIYTPYEAKDAFTYVNNVKSKTNTTTINYGVRYSINITDSNTNETDFYNNSVTNFNKYVSKIIKLNQTTYSELGISVAETDFNLYFTEVISTDENNNATTLLTAIYDYTSVNTKLIDKAREVNTTLESLNSQLNAQLNNLVDQTLGFKPTIGKVFDIIGYDASSFLKLLKESGDNSERTHQSIQRDTPILAYPRVVRGDGVTIYPGEIPAFKDWKEVKFVEDFINAYLQVKRQDIEFENTQTQTDTSARKYIPLGTNDFNSLSYNGDTNLDSLFSKLFTRYYILTQYSYKGFWEGSTFDVRTQPLMNFIANSESENMLSSIWDEKLLNQLKTNLTEIKKDSSNAGFGYFNNTTNRNLYTNTINTLTTGLNSGGQLIGGVNLVPNNNSVNYKGLSLLSEKPTLVEGGISTTQEPTKYLNDFVNGDNFFKKLTNSINYFDKTPEKLINLNINITTNNLLYFNDTNYSNTEYTSDFYPEKNILNYLIFEFNNYTNNNFLSGDLTLAFSKQYNPQQHTDDYENLITILKQKLSYPSIIEIPYITLINLGRIANSSTFINIFGPSDLTFLKNIYLDFINNVRPTVISELNKIKQFNNTVFSSTSDSLNYIISNPSLFPVTLSLFELKYLQNETSFTFLSDSEYNNKTTFTPLIVNGTHNSLDNTVKGDNKVQLFLDTFISSTINKINARIKTITDQNKEFENFLKDNDVKRQIYYSFKNMYDRWMADDLQVPANSGTTPFSFQDIYFDFKSRFQFIDRGFNEIGNDMIIDITPLIEATDTPDTSLYTGISTLLSKNNFEFFPLPNLITYNNSTSKWEDMFKIFNDVTNISNKTSFTCMYVGSYSTSKDDYVSFADNSKIPANLNTDNVHCFNVFYGKQNQMIFQNIELNTEEIKETGESLMLVDQMLNNKGNVVPTVKTQSLFEVFEKRSYTCNLTIPLGNTCVQPTGYFEILHIPMFQGVYIILEVNHSIDGDSNRVNTVVKGTRIGKFVPPIVTDMFTLVTNIDADFANITQNNSQAILQNSFAYQNPDYPTTKTNVWTRKNGKNTKTIVRFDGKTGKYILK